MLRITAIGNLAARAFGLAPPPFPADVMPCASTEVYSRAATGMCDAALLPAACLRGLQHVVGPPGAYGIATAGPAHSVVLQAGQPLARVAARFYRDVRPRLTLAGLHGLSEFLRVRGELEPWVKTA